MLRLTREVRFTIPLTPLPNLSAPPLYGLCGNLVEGAGIYLCLRVTLTGTPNADSQYIQNIKVIDQRVRSNAIPAIAELVYSQRFTPARALLVASAAMKGGWMPASLEGVTLVINPYLLCSARIQELPMVQLTHRFEFSAAHRLHNPEMSDAENREVFGKCNNPAGHGHNYEFEVTLAGAVDAAGRLIELTRFQQIVNDTVITLFDHKHLNTQTTQFAQTIPTVENIAKVIYEMLAPHFPGPTTLRSVRVWETGKTWAEYSR